VLGGTACAQWRGFVLSMLKLRAILPESSKVLEIGLYICL
jgi:hypothetical protein